MSNEATAPRRARQSEATASHTVQFQTRPRCRTQRHHEPIAGRVPRVARFLALAHKIDGMIRAGEIKDWAEASRLVGVTRARMTQIANLLLLAPIIQENILTFPSALKGPDPLTEHDLRDNVASLNWVEQRISW